MIGLTIYLVGFVATYLLCKYIRTENTWGDIYSCLFWSIFSWLGFLVILFVILLDYIERKEPPKWL